MEQQKHIGQKIRTLNNLMRRNMELRLRHHGVTLMQAWIIRYICRSGENPVFQRDVEAEFSISRSTASGILDLMEERGYLVRRKAAHDARLKQLCLTEKALDLHKELRDGRPLMEQYLSADIPPEDLAAFHRVADKLREKLEQLVECQNRAAEGECEAKEECAR